MVARPGPIQQSMNAGELSPDAHGRIDVKQYYSAAAAMRNVEAKPQGGFRLQPRSLFRGKAGRLATRQATTTLGAPTGAITAGTVILTADLGANAALCGADITIQASAVVADGVKLQVQDASLAWSDVSLVFDVGTASISRRFCLPPGAPVTGRRVRLIAAASVTITAATITPLVETRTLVARHFAFSFSVAQVYRHVVTAGHVDIWRDGVFVGAAANPYTAPQIPDLKQVQRLASEIFWHQEVAPYEVRRQGSDHEWSSGSVAFMNIPEVDLGGTYSSVTEIWNIHFSWDSGKTATYLESFVVTINGEDTALFSPTRNVGAGYTSQTDWPVDIPTLKGLIEALAAVAPGIIITVARDAINGATLAVEFAGSGNAGEQFVVTAKCVTNSGAAAANTSRTRRGKRGGEAIFSPSRGYPLTGKYFQNRLLMGGFQSKEGAWVESRTGEYFDLNAELETAASAIVLNLDVDGAERIVHFHEGRHLLIFSDSGHYFVSTAVHNRLQPMSVVKSSGVGAAQNIPIVETEQQILYVDKTRSRVMATNYSDVSQRYDEQPISLLASHLMVGLNGAALRRGNSDLDADRYYLTRDDGVLVVGGLLRNQDVTGFTRWETDGYVRSVAVDLTGTTTLLIERTVNGAQELFLEELTPTVFLDAAVTITQASSVTVSGLAMHEGATVWAVADGYTEGPFTVTGGAITLPRAATSIIVGRWTAPRAPLWRSLPLLRQIGERQVVRRPMRSHTARIWCNSVSSIAVGANGRPVRDQPLWGAGDDADGPPVPFSGLLTVGAMRGFSDTGQLEITQVRPGWLDIRDVTQEARI
jgi:hypothetical protein